MRQKIIRSVVDGKVCVAYTFDGMPTVHAELTGPSADLVCKYQFAIKELELVARYMRKIERVVERYSAGNQNLVLIDDALEDRADFQAYFSTATICYGKIFSKVGAGRRQYLPKFFFSGDGSKYMPLHEWWMKVRHECIAHSAGEPYDRGRVIILSEPPYTGGSWWWVFPHVQYSIFLNIKEVRSLIGMVEYMFSILKAEQEKQLKDVASKLTPAERAEYRRKSVYSSHIDAFPSPPLI